MSENLNTLRNGGEDRADPNAPLKVRRTINPQTPNTNPNPKHDFELTAVWKRER